MKLLWAAKKTVNLLVASHRIKQFSCVSTSERSAMFQLVILSPPVWSGDEDIHHVVEVFPLLNDV